MKTEQQFLSTPKILQESINEQQIGVLKSSVKAKTMQQSRGDSGLEGGSCPEEPSVPLSRGLLAERRCSGRISADESSGTFITSIKFALVSRSSAERRGKKNPQHFLRCVFCFQGSLSTKYYWNSRWQNANFMKGKAALSRRLLFARESCAREEEGREGKARS